MTLWQSKTTKVKLGDNNKLCNLNHLKDVRMGNFIRMDYIELLDSQLT